MLKDLNIILPRILLTVNKPFCFITGEFDPPSMNPYTSIDMSVVQSPEHQALAMKAAQMTFTLLKNEFVLPLRAAVPNVAVSRV